MKRSARAVTSFVATSCLVRGFYRSMKVIVPFVATLLLFTATPAQQESPVSMMRLIATPDKYDGQKVQVVESLVLEFEGNALYMHETVTRTGSPKMACGWL